MITEDNKKQDTELVLDTEFNLFDRFENIQAKMLYMNISIYGVLGMIQELEIDLKPIEITGFSMLQNDIEVEFRDIYDQLFEHYLKRRNKNNV